MRVFRGIENIMTATPANIAGPMSSYNETSAKVIYHVVSMITQSARKIKIEFTWNGPDMAMSP